MISVSIHDVSPAFEREIDDALAACAKVSAKPALLVVPNFHGKWPLDRYPAFVDRLRALRDDGHEIILHGFFHVSDGGSFFAQKIASAGEAEFADLAQSEGERRIDEGKKILEDIGLAPDGFIAPAWQMARWVLPALASRGFRYAEDHLHVYDPAGGRRKRSLVLNFASRTPARLWSSVAFVRAATPFRRVVRTRIAIHPGDMRSSFLRREVHRVLAAPRAFVSARSLTV
ncbi:MAG TPA: polysaccharide deacetylase family protein [Polyangiaceae bacterium]|nr:polysaccharide deacetylase family protein [Polyangiaceae bacterium]